MTDVLAYIGRNTFPLLPSARSGPWICDSSGILKPGNDLLGLDVIFDE